ncbi:DUF3768 domain-containing protein [Qipengyuania sp. 483]
MDFHGQDDCARRWPTQQQKRVSELNDQFRRERVGGYFCITDGIVNLGHQIYLEIIAAIAEFNDFTPDNDPHCEHDFGSMQIAGETIFWKIDYYDQSQTYASPDPSDPSATQRLLTIMLASEY